MQDLMAFIKILSDETRLRLIMALSEKAFCVCELVELLDETQPKISKHLARLKDLNLVHTNRNNQFIYYELAIKPTHLRAIIDTIKQDLKHYPVLVKDYDRIKAINNRPFKCTQGEEA